MLYILGGILVSGWVLARVTNRSAHKSQGLLSTWKGFFPNNLLYSQPYLAPLLAFLTIYILATLFSIDPALSLSGGDSYQGLLSFTVLVLLFYLTTNVLRQPFQVDRIITGILIGSFPVSIYGCVQIIGADPLKWNTTSTSGVHSTVGYSLYLGAYLAMVAPFSLRRLFTRQEDGIPRRPAAYALLLILQVACILFTRSRGALISLVVGCIIFFGLLVFRSFKPSKSAWTIVAGIGVLLFIAGVFSTIIYSGRVNDLLGSAVEVNPARLMQNRLVSNTARLTLWQQTLPIIAGRPWLGYGPGTFGLAFTDYYPEVVLDNPQELQYWDAHNLFLSHLASAGILGLAAFLGVVVVFYWKTLALIKNCPDRSIYLTSAAIISSASAFLVQAQFNPSGIVPTFLFWLVMAMGAGLAIGFETGRSVE